MLSLELLKEMLVFGLMCGVIGTIISTGIMFLPNKDGKQFDLKEYHFWWQVFLAHVATGMVAHLLCEVSGVNKWYCSNGNACR